MSLPGYDNWKCTDPALENEWDWTLACEEYEDSPEYKEDLANFLKEMKEEDPDGEYDESDYQFSSTYEDAVEALLKGDEY